MTAPFRIAVFGVGAVGGYYGGRLAARYCRSEAIEIVFLAKPNHARIIEAQGLRIVTPKEGFVARPARVTSDFKEAGPVDLILCCVKGYDLEAAATLAPCLTGTTIILPLQNGLDVQERMAAILPQAEVWHGCVYVFSRLIAPGEVRASGALDAMFFGSEKAKPQALDHVEEIFQSAGINARSSVRMRRKIWEKFFLLSTIATLTSYFDRDLGGIMGNPQGVDLLKALLAELKAVADAEGIERTDDLADRTLASIAELPAGTTSSMRTDFQCGRATELESITGMVVKLGKSRNVATPRYSMVLKELRTRTSDGGMRT